MRLTFSNFFFAFSISLILFSSSWDSIHSSVRSSSCLDHFSFFLSFGSRWNAW